jgi:hypothetical protein
MALPLAPPNMSPINGRAESLRSGSLAGPFTSLADGVKDRIAVASVTVTCRHGTRYGGAYRVGTSLLTPSAYPPTC